MKKIKVMNEYVKFNIYEKLAFYTNVLDKLTGNPYFLAPYISLIEVRELLSGLEAAIIAAADGSRIAISVMRDKEALCDAAYRILASYVEHTANGNQTQILSSGFNASKQPVYKLKSIIDVFNGIHAGQVNVIAKAVLNAAIYYWQYRIHALDGLENDWIAGPMTTCAHFTLEGLVPGVMYDFRVATVSASGTTDFCPFVSFRVS